MLLAVLTRGIAIHGVDHQHSAFVADTATISRTPEKRETRDRVERRMKRFEATIYSRVVADVERDERFIVLQQLGQERCHNKKRKTGVDMEAVEREMQSKRGCRLNSTAKSNLQIRYLLRRR
jgi:hypothetical protein